MTNTRPNSCVDVVCDCATMWSFAQQFCYVRLSDPVPGQAFKNKFLQDSAVRARRIAATYARFYLEQENSAGSEDSKKGRFYWMALAAFASKTVACALEDKRVHLTRTTVHSLGKGNLWLFNDIAAWHFYYAKHRSSFDMCLNQRDASALVSKVKAQVKKLPWSAEALNKVNNLKVTNEIKKGFDKVKEFESEADATEKIAIQLQHLLAIADHEQRLILQPLIYDDPDFAFWVRMQRSPLVSWASPGLELVFTSACSTSDPEKKSVAPTGTELERIESRMSWINAAATMFHVRMQKNTADMERELQVMAGWLALKDS